MRLHRAILFARDMPRMTAFYRDGCGLQMVAERSDDQWVEFDTGGAQLALHAIPAAIAKRITIGYPPAARRDNPIKLVFETGDLDATRAHLTAHGATMFEPTHWQGQSWCDGLDPEGNVFQVART